MNSEKLMEMAEKAMPKAYSPYSCFKVGAAILTDDGRVFTGCNVENASYGGTICAERCAAVKAVSEGATAFKSIAIAGSSQEYTYPCGICRQFLSEFFDKDGLIILKDRSKGLLEVPFWDMLPHAFTGDSIK